MKKGRIKKSIQNWTWGMLILLMKTLSVNQLIRFS